MLSLKRTVTFLARIGLTVFFLERLGFQLWVVGAKMSANMSRIHRTMVVLMSPMMTIHTLLRPLLQHRSLNRHMFKNKCGC